MFFPPLQECLYENITSIDLRKCEFIRKLPGFRATNLGTLDLGGCGNLTEVHDNIGLLDKLKYLVLEDCEKLEILPSKLNLKSLEYLYLTNCKRLKKFPQIHPEMKCVKNLAVRLGGTCVRKLPSSLRYLTSGLKYLFLNEVQNLDLSFAQYGFSSLIRLDLSHFDGNMVDLNIWLRPDYFPVLETLILDYLTSGPNTLHLPVDQNLDLSFSQYGFPSLTNLDLSYFDRNMCDLNIWLKPDRFPVLESLWLQDSNIVTIPESITKFTRLQDLMLKGCKQLQEIPRLPQSIILLEAQECRSLDLQSSRRLLDQVSFYLSIIVTFLNYV